MQFALLCAWHLSQMHAPDEQFSTRRIALRANTPQQISLRQVIQEVVVRL